ncbi:MAG: methylated-DNA--[protein]-cysteine S-methyltransferase [Clostridiaceae bacterium]|nr:methylated-DNA--[protein]-cysteine S-methyltransferase [Clostridiaceae bacterium]
MMYYTTIYQSPLGPLTLACQDDALIGLWMEGQKYFGEGLPAGPPICGSSAVLSAAENWLDRYFSGEKPNPQELTLRPAGTPFRQVLWKLLCEIPYGETTTYGKLARNAAQQMHRPSMSGQAVGGAVGHNPISIIIPCHRVVAANGSLAGYAGGIERKLQLLTLEGVDISRLHMPAGMH